MNHAKKAFDGVQTYAKSWEGIWCVSQVTGQDIGPTLHKQETIIDLYSSSSQANKAVSMALIN